MALILDAKRGDIGSTAEHYAREVFSRYGAHAVTVNPYLGGDSVMPYFALGGAVIALCRTSNPGSADLQSLDCGGEPLYVRVARMVADEWVQHGECGLVVGATFPDELAVGARGRRRPPDPRAGRRCATRRRGGGRAGRRDDRRPGADRQQLAIDPLRVGRRRLRGRREGRHDRGACRAHRDPPQSGYLPLRSRCVRPGQQHGRRWPSSSSSWVRRMRRSRVVVMTSHVIATQRRTGALDASAPRRRYRA